MALLVTVVLGDVVKVFTADDDGTVHLGRDDTAGKDTATDGDLTGEGALLVYRFYISDHSRLHYINQKSRTAWPPKIWRRILRQHSAKPVGRSHVEFAAVVYSSPTS